MLASISKYRSLYDLPSPEPHSSAYLSFSLPLPTSSNVSILEMSTTLPDELVLQICKYVSHEDLWLSLRSIDRQWRCCAEDVLQESIGKDMTIGLNYSMGVGTRHRVRGHFCRMFAGFKCCDVMAAARPGFRFNREIDKEMMLIWYAVQWYDIRASITFGCNEIWNEHVFFDKPVFLPESCSDRAMQKWKILLAGGIDYDQQAWKVTLVGNDVRYALLPNAVISQHGMRLDWRELLNAFFRKTVPPEQYWARQWRAV